ncbi:MAG: phosphatase PAP2 family protein [candidate division WS1 bacterium]|nr:phosphatase PAP2 family protein [candidate division WS1 bacterium]
MPELQSADSAAATTSRPCMARRYLPLAGIVVFIAISILLLDEPIVRGTLEFRQAPVIVELGEIAADLGDRLAVAAIAVLMILTAGYRWKRLAPAVLVGLTSGSALVDGLKYLTGRVRPGDLDSLGVEPAFYGPGCPGNSFPSGHAMAASMLAVLAGVYFPRARLIAYTLAVFVGLGRIALDRHFLSDVVAGATLGYLMACLMLHWWPVPASPDDTSDTGDTPKACSGAGTPERIGDVTTTDE